MSRTPMAMWEMFLTGIRPDLKNSVSGRRAPTLHEGPRPGSRSRLPALQLFVSRGCGHGCPGCLAERCSPSSSWPSRSSSTTIREPHGALDHRRRPPRWPEGAPWLVSPGRVGERAAVSRRRGRPCGRAPCPVENDSGLAGRVGALEVCRGDAPPAALGGGRRTIRPPRAAHRRQANRPGQSRPPWRPRWKLRWVLRFSVGRRSPIFGRRSRWYAGN